MAAVGLPAPPCLVRKPFTNAYRRDREKDALLQENGFYVLRFLAEDVGQQLDRVLDTVLRAMDNLQRRG